VKGIARGGNRDTDTESSTEAGSDSGQVDGVGAGDCPDRRRHLPSYSRAVADPILADDGGVAGKERRDCALLRPQPTIVTTAGSAERLVDFSRAMVIDPVVVWAPGGDWPTGGLVFEALEAEPFNRAALQGSFRSTPVKELRLLHGALVSLYSSFCTQPRVRVLALNFLLALCSTDVRN